MRFSSLYAYCPVCGSSDFVVNSQKSMRCNNCSFVYYMNPSAAVAAFITNEERKLLVCIRAKEPEKGTLDLPGGFVDECETAEQALVRELNEELGVQVSQIKYLFSIPNRYEYSGLTIPTLDLFYVCSIHSADTIKPDDDVADCSFIPLDELNPQLFGLESIRQAVTIFKDEIFKN